MERLPSRPPLSPGRLSRLVGQWLLVTVSCPDSVTLYFAFPVDPAVSGELEIRALAPIVVDLTRWMLVLKIDLLETSNERGIDTLPLPIVDIGPSVGNGVGLWCR